MVDDSMDHAQNIPADPYEVQFEYCYIQLISLIFTSLARGLRQEIFGRDLH